MTAPRSVTRANGRVAPETPVDLTLWFMNGACGTGNDLKARRSWVDWPKVSIGRTDSRSRLGFAVKMRPRGEWILFTLDRAQVKNLHRYLAYQLPRVKKWKLKAKRSRARKAAQ